MADGIKFQVDGRSLRSFNRKVSVSMRGIVGCTKSALAEFCEDILIDATRLVPIDTGALARSAGYEIRGRQTKGYKAKVGYGFSKHNKVNRRTGKRASTYAGTVHEDLATKHTNGQAKFFEQALYAHEQELETYSRKKISKYLSTQEVQPYIEEDVKSKEAEREAIINSRIQEGFTTQVGKRLPFPVPEKMVYYKGGRWYLNKNYEAQKTKKKQRKATTSAKPARKARVSVSRKKKSKQKSTRSMRHEQALSEFMNILTTGEDDKKR